MTELRRLGFDAVSGKHAYALPRPDGLLEGMADAHTWESAAVLVRLVGVVLEGGEATDAELAAFVPSLYEMLDECVKVATRES
ncbi:hypothetical protein ACN6K6_007457 [Streptomyces violaceoruber]|uniref:hypothetical protein n=1 Tax=Streptomyces violaceoruber TaxID=1935 RepID=UPI00403C1A0B